MRGTVSKAPEEDYGLYTYGHTYAYSQLHMYVPPQHINMHTRTYTCMQMHAHKQKLQTLLHYLLVW